MSKNFDFLRNILQWNFFIGKVDFTKIYLIYKITLGAWKKIYNGKLGFKVSKKGLKIRIEVTEWEKKNIFLTVLKRGHGELMG